MCRDRLPIQCVGQRNDANLGKAPETNADVRIHDRTSRVAGGPRSAPSTPPFVGDFLHSQFGATRPQPGPSRQSRPRKVVTSGSLSAAIVLLSRQSYQREQVIRAQDGCFLDAESDIPQGSGDERT